jgi:hypothetical protein
MIPTAQRLDEPTRLAPSVAAQGRQAVEVGSSAFAHPSHAPIADETRCALCATGTSRIDDIAADQASRHT